MKISKIDNIFYFLFFQFIHLKGPNIETFTRKYKKNRGK